MIKQRHPPMVDTTAKNVNIDLSPLATLEVCPKPKIKKAMKKHAIATNNHPHHGRSDGLNGTVSEL
jgi:hypothetical protein